MSFLDHCRRLVSLESTPSHGTQTAAEFVGRLCEEAGLHVEYQRESTGGVDQCNLIARPQPTVPEHEFLLQTHLDTPPAGHFSHWTKTQSNPFNASIYNDTLYGLGTSDGKLDILCKLEAVRPFLGRKFRLPFVLVGTYGAHSGMSGAIKLIRRKKLNATLALIGEPTQKRLVNSGTGLAVVEIVIPFSSEERAYRREHDMMESTSTQSRLFTGKREGDHEPVPGENAIMKMLEYMSRLPDGIAVMDLDGGTDHDIVPDLAILEIDTVAGFRDPVLPRISHIYQSLIDLEKELRGFRQEGFNPPYATMNLGMIRTTESDVRISGNCRFPPTVTHDVFESWMAKLTQAAQMAGSTFSVRDYRQGFETDAEKTFVRQAQELLRRSGHDAELHKVSMASEANVFSRWGVDCLVWGPGQSVGNSHGPNESIKISDLEAATEFYRLVVERFCL